MQKANNLIQYEGGEIEMMSDNTLHKLIEYLESIGWSDTEIVNLLDYIASK